MGTGPEQALFARYTARLRPPLRVIELPDGRGSPSEIKRREGDALLAAIPDGALAIALDAGGSEPDSLALATRLIAWRDSGRILCFVIGGAEGFDGRILARADFVFSLGKLTWPHMLVRVMLAEQLYRAQSIASGHPYHRAGRPVPGG